MNCSPPIPKAESTLRRGRVRRDFVLPLRPGLALRGGGGAGGAGVVAIGHGGHGQTSFGRFGRVRYLVDGTEVFLGLYWLEGYGGGCSSSSAIRRRGPRPTGEGRYLLDRVKGAGLGHTENRLVFDFNYPYHSSCVYSTRWSCPSPPKRIPWECRLGPGSGLSRSPPDRNPDEGRWGDEARGMQTR
ncbi:MAG: DUF1684 domain-containing protein [Acidimicrobiia bacterium]